MHALRQMSGQVGWSAHPSMSTSDLAPFTFAALYLFSASVPVTHGLGLVAHWPRKAKWKHLLLYPVLGGRHHTIFQLLSWVVWGLSLLIALPVVTKSALLRVQSSHSEALAAAAAVGVVVAELFMIKSLLTFNPKCRHTDGEAVVWNLKNLPSKTAASSAVVAMGLLWVMMASALLLATEYLDNRHSRETYVVLSGVCLLVGAFTTYGLGGSLRHRAEEGVGGWQFWQPFRGGTAFVATQALGWALFSGALVGLCWLVTQATAGVAAAIRAALLGTGAMMFSAQLLLAASVWVYKDAVGQAVASAVQEARQPKSLTAAARHRAAIWLPILMLYMPVQMFVAVLTLSFMVLPGHYAGAGWVGAALLYYGITGSGAPEETGRREWPAFREWTGRHIEPALRAWFGRVEVVREGAAAPDPAAKYIFGYHPHGLFPIGMGYLSLMPAWRQLLPGIRPAMLTASVVFFCPVIRDLVAWAGFRQVGRRSFVRALHERGAVLFVPGGQAELVHTHRISSPSRRQWAVITRHKGFVRLAIEEGAALVPVVVLGEIDCLRNLITAPRLQQWSYKKLGFPIPYLVVGRWRLSPLPSCTGLKFVIGEPIPPPPHTPGEQVAQPLVDELHAQYFEQVVALFEKHKQGFPGYEDVQLATVDD